MSNRNAVPELISVLREIRNQQREAIHLQREHMAFRQQLNRLDRINDSAEAMQGRGGKALKLILWVACPARKP